MANTTTKSGGGAAAAPLSLQALGYMFLLSLQFGMQPVLTRRFTPPGIVRSSVVLMQEVVKFFLALALLTSSGTWSKAIAGWSITSWISVAALPAALYCMQNMAALLAYQNLDPITFNVLNQTKTLSAALCCYLVIGRKQSRVQVASLLLLLLSALVIEKLVTLDFLLPSSFRSGDSEPVPSDDDDEKKTSAYASAKHLTHGVLPVLLASFLSGLAGAITQKNLQSASGCDKSGGKNALLFSMELCVASVFFLTASLLASDDGKRIAQKGFFDQWTPQTMVPIVTNSFGGLIVGLVTKYAGSVRKGFALIFGIFLSGLVQAAADPEAGISKEEVTGGFLAAISLWMHATHPYISQTTDVVPESKPQGSATSNGAAHKRSGRKSRKED